MKERGMLIILSGPSGVGKGTVREHLFSVNDSMNYSVSMTTRSPRNGEVDGVDYLFVDREEFQRNIESDNMLEWAEFVGNYYGTPLDNVEDMLASGKDVLLEIEIQGALQVKNKIPDAIFIFLMPTSLAELENRLRKRGTESEEIIKERINKAKSEIPLRNQYNYVIINDEVKRVTDVIMSIIKLEKTLRGEM